MYDGQPLVEVYEICNRLGLKTVLSDSDRPEYKKRLDYFNAIYADDGMVIGYERNFRMAYIDAEGNCPSIGAWASNFPFFNQADKNVIDYLPENECFYPQEYEYSKYDEEGNLVEICIGVPCAKRNIGKLNPKYFFVEDGKFWNHLVLHKQGKFGVDEYFAIDNDIVRETEKAFGLGDGYGRNVTVYGWVAKSTIIEFGGNKYAPAWVLRKIKCLTVLSKHSIIKRYDLDKQEFIV